ncbi:MAG: ParB/RepB/Spo0J family partition protein [bacterium]|nr:ParB/RepB/Spo0J family partition protein [bacterium]
MAKLKVSNPLDMGGNPPEVPITMEQVASEMYGTLDLPSSNKVIARPVMLADIKPDVKQPRRIIPAGIRKGWTGDVSKIPDMLRDWRIMAEKALGESLDPVALVSKFTDGREADKDMPAIAEEYLALCALAASINKDGLAYAIQITGRNAPHVIVTGERRYMAHWLLKVLLGPKWDSIPAVVVSEPDVWLQAAENGNRRSLNAIAMARQLALLVMEQYIGDDGVKFDDIGFFNHEREFYAQVANGNIWRIKKGLGERVLQVTGLKSIAQVNQYRALLSISNELWDEADMNNWTEFRIREIVRPQNTSTGVDVYTGDKKVNGVYTSTIVDVSANQPTMADMVFNKFADSMRVALRQYVHRNNDGNGLFGRGKNLMFIWWNRAFNGFEIITESGGYVQAGKAWDIEMVIKQMWANLSDVPAWQIMTKVKWDAMVNPPLPKTFAPPPTPSSFDADESRRAIMGDDDDDFVGDDVRHPFGWVANDDPDYQAYLDDMGRVDEALEELKALGDAERVSRQDSTRPPSDYPEPPVIAGNGLENALLRVLQALAEADGDGDARHAATMLIQFTRKDVMDFVGIGQWEELSLRWYELLNGVMQKVLIGMFDKLDKAAKP